MSRRGSREYVLHEKVLQCERPTNLFIAGSSQLAFPWTSMDAIRQAVREHLAGVRRHHPEPISGTLSRWHLRYLRCQRAFTSSVSACLGLCHVVIYTATYSQASKSGVCLLCGNIDHMGCFHPTSHASDTLVLWPPYRGYDQRAAFEGTTILYVSQDLYTILTYRLRTTRGDEH